MISGQIITQTSHQVAPDGRPIIMIVGVLAVDKDSPLNKEGMQFVVGGPSEFHDATRMLPLNILQDGQTDRSKLAKGEKLGDMLMKSIWRV